MERKQAEITALRKNMKEWEVVNAKENPIQEKGLTGSDLKWIAIITMLIDHTAVALIENGIFVSESFRLSAQQWNIWYRIYWIMRLIGRLGFPIFCFLLVEGFCYTHDVKKYMLRLGIFALISEIPFDFACFRSIFYSSYQNVYFTLLIGMITLCGIKRFEGGTIKNRLLRIGCLFAGMAVAYLLMTDYSFFGVVLIVIFYVFRGKEKVRDLFAGLVLLCNSLVEVTGLLVFIPMHFYNGKRGKQSKYFFYAFYPVHLLILGLVARFIIC